MTAKTSRGVTPALDELDVHEAFRISEQARGGHLNLLDPEIARVVQDANQLVVRSQLWGDTPIEQRRRSHRLLMIGVSVIIGICTLTIAVSMLRG